MLEWYPPHGGNSTKIAGIGGLRPQGPYAYYNGGSAIDGIKTWAGSGKVNGIQVRVNGVYQKRRGSNVGAPYEYLLDEHEYFTQISVRSSQSQIDQVRLVTNFGHIIVRGGDGGKLLHEPREKGYVLYGFGFAQSDTADKISQLSFQWGPPQYITPIISIIPKGGPRAFGIGYGSNTGGSEFKPNPFGGLRTSAPKYRNGGCVIDGIRIWANTYVHAITFRTNGVWNQKQGKDIGLKAKELVFEQHEYITRVDIRHGAKVDRVKFVTNIGNVIEGGGNGGGASSEPGSIGQVLYGVGGRSGNDIDQLKFQWGSPTYALPSTPQWGTRFGIRNDNIPVFAAQGIWTMNFPKHNISIITGIEIRSGTEIDSIRLQVDGKWKTKYGGNGGSLNALILAKDEFFNYVELKYTDRLVWIKFTTSKGRNISCGTENSNLQRWTEGIIGEQRLVDIRGSAHTRVHEIQFLWVNAKGFELQAPISIKTEEKTQEEKKMQVVQRAPRDRLDTNEQLVEGEFLQSLNGAYYLLMQGDGNLVLYASSDFTPINAKWSSNTHGQGQKPYRCIMQSDSNLVVYDGTNKPLWASNTHGKGSNPSCIMQNDGNFVVYSQEAQWDSGTRA